MSSVQMGEHIHFYEKLASINYQSFKHLLREWPPRPTTDVRERIFQEPRLWLSLEAGDDKSSFWFPDFCFCTCGHGTVMPTANTAASNPILDCA